MNLTDIKSRFQKWSKERQVGVVVVSASVLVIGTTLFFALATLFQTDAGNNSSGTSNTASQNRYSTSFNTFPAGESPKTKDEKYVKARRLYQGSEGEKPDKERALALLEEAMEEGSLEAQALLAREYLFREKLDKTDDYSTARILATKPAEANVAEGNSVLGDLFYNGYGVTKDETKAQEYYRKAFQQYEKDAQKGDSFAMNAIGVCYFYGEGVEEDKVKANEWYRKSANLENSVAMRNLGVNYENGDGIEKDVVKANEWYRKAAELGNARAMTYLGVNYFNGAGVEEDKVKAIEWYQKAAESGNSDAMVNLGVCYVNGTGVTKDEKKAIEWYQKAAELGNAVAMLNLGVNYHEGAGVEKDETKAFEWTERAAENGNASAMSYLFVFYVNAWGTDRNDELAFEWAKKGVETDSRDGFCVSKLASCYENGVGVEQDYDKARELFEESLRLGYEQAQECLDQLEKKVDRKEIQKGFLEELKNTLKTN